MDRTPSEQEEFVDLFGDVLQRGYLALIGSKVRITGGVHVTFIDEAVAGDVAVVRTALTGRSNGELSIDYRGSRADGTWWVVDTIIGGVSLVANYRTQTTLSTNARIACPHRPASDTSAPDEPQLVLGDDGQTREPKPTP
jgi:ABC-type transporter MlaC component